MVVALQPHRHDVLSFPVPMLANGCRVTTPATRRNHQSAHGDGGPVPGDHRHRRHTRDARHACLALETHTVTVAP